MYIPVSMAAQEYGIDISNENVEECLDEAISECFYEQVELFFSGNRREYAFNWLKENKGEVLELFEYNLQQIEE